jgi:hypothetical protein
MRNDFNWLQRPRALPQVAGESHLSRSISAPHNASLPPHSASFAGDTKSRDAPKNCLVRAGPARLLNSDLRPLAWPLPGQRIASGKPVVGLIGNVLSQPLAYHWLTTGYPMGGSRQCAEVAVFSGFGLHSRGRATYSAAGTGLRAGREVIRIDPPWPQPPGEFLRSLAGHTPCTPRQT